jgi:hypothetical protein
MKLDRIIQVAGSLACIALMLLLGAGCKSSGYEQGNKAAANIQEAANLIGALPAQIDKTLASLDTIVQNPQGDLTPKFKQFSTNLGELESSAKDVASARTAMQSKSKDFFAKWNEQLATIQNEDIKARSLSRKEEVSKKLDAVGKSYTEAASAFKPFMADLKDVQKFLGMDLTAGGVESIKKTAAKVSKDAQPVKEALAKVSADFKALGLTMSSAAPPPAPAK